MLFSIGEGTVALSGDAAVVRGTGRSDGIYRDPWTLTFVMITQDVMGLGRQALNRDEIASLVLDRSRVPYFRPKNHLCFSLVLPINSSRIVYFTRDAVFTQLCRRVLRELKRVLYARRRLALAMALHHRLGAESCLGLLDADLLSSLI